MRVRLGVQSMRELLVPKVSTTPLLMINRLWGEELGVSCGSSPARDVTRGDESSVYRHGDRALTWILGLRSTDEMSTPECKNLMMSIANRSHDAFHGNAGQKMAISGQCFTTDVPRSVAAPARHVSPGIRHANVLPRSSCLGVIPW